MSVIPKSMQSPATVKSERPEQEESFLEKNSSFIKGAAAGAATVGVPLLLKTALENLLKSKKPPHKHGLSFGKLGALAGAASVLHSVVHPFTCGGGGMLFGGAALLSSFLPKIWGGKSKGTCGHNHAKPVPPSPAS